jgi:general secretion pathway protein D
VKFANFPRRILTIAILSAALVGCANNQFYKDGISSIKDGRSSEGINQLGQATRAEPGNATIRKDWLVQRDLYTSQLMAQVSNERVAGQYEKAIALCNQILAVDPGHLGAIQTITAIDFEKRQAVRLEDAAALLKRGDIESANVIISRVLQESPAHVKANLMKTQSAQPNKSDTLNGVSLNLKGRKPVTLQFRDANLKMVMEAISRTTGLNVLFDKDVRTDLKVTIFVRETPVEEAVDLLLLQTQTAKRVLGENSILIYPDTTAKAREYVELKIRRFPLVNADPKQVLAMVKAMSKSKDSFVDEKTNALIIRDTPAVIRLVEKLIATMDQAEPEVMLEVDVMEIARDRILALGIDLPTSFGASIDGKTLMAFRARTSADINLSPLSVTAKAQRTDSDINDLATPRIRVRNKEKAKFLVGDRLPVISTAAVPGSTNTAPVYNTNVQYIEVGIKIEVEPTIHSDGEVALKLNLEVSSAGEPNPDAAKAGTIAYSVSTRNLTTVLRLKDGQTEVIGGLIQEKDRSRAIRIPGAGDVPILGRLFGSQTDTRGKNEIVLAITPRIVRNAKLFDSEDLEMWSGTENNLKIGTKVLGNTSNSGPAPFVPTGTTNAPGAAPVVQPTAVPTPAPTPASDTVPAAPASVEPAPATPSSAIPPATLTPPLTAVVPPRAPSRRLGAGSMFSQPDGITAGAGAQGSSGTVGTTNSSARDAPPASLWPLSLTGSNEAKVGQTVDVAIVMPKVPASTDLECTVTFDATRLKFVGTTDSTDARIVQSGARFTADEGASGVITIRLVSGRGEGLPTDGGTIGRLQFEALTVLGPAPVQAQAGTLKGIDSKEYTFPGGNGVSVTVRAAQ